MRWETQKHPQGWLVDEEGLQILNFVIVSNQA
jgi:hypothetical protein